MAVGGIVVVAAIAVLVFAALGIRIVREYERIVVFRLGRERGARGPRPDLDHSRRDRRAKMIAAEGEFQAAARLEEAAAMLGREKHAITLRTLQTLAEIATEQNSTLIFPIPADLISVLRDHAAPLEPPPTG